MESGKRGPGQGRRPLSPQRELGTCSGLEEAQKVLREKIQNRVLEQGWVSLYPSPCKLDGGKAKAGNDSLDTGSLWSCLHRSLKGDLEQDVTRPQHLGNW